MTVEIYTLTGAAAARNEAKMYAKVQKLAPTIAHAFPQAQPEELPRLLMETFKLGALYVRMETERVLTAVYVGAQGNSLFNILLFDGTADNTDLYKGILEDALKRFPRLNKVSVQAISDSPLATQLFDAGFRTVGTQRRETLIGETYADTVLLERLQGEELPEVLEEEEDDVIEKLETQTTPHATPAPAPALATAAPARTAGPANGMDGANGLIKEFFQMPRYE